MKEFLELNSKNLKEGYVWISGILIIGFTLFLAFFYSQVQTKWIVIVLFVILFVVPFFIFSVWSFDWYRNRKNYKRILSNKPFDKLSDIGFIKRTVSTIHMNGMKDYIQYARINGFDIFITVDFNNPKIIRFTTNGKIHESDKFEINRKKHESDKLEVFNYGVSRIIDPEKERMKSIQELEKELIELTKIAKNLEFEPISISEYNTE